MRSQERLDFRRLLELVAKEMFKRKLTWNTVIHELGYAYRRVKRLAT